MKEFIIWNEWIFPHADEGTTENHTRELPEELTRNTLRDICVCTKEDFAVELKRMDVLNFRDEERSRMLDQTRRSCQH